MKTKLLFGSLALAASVAAPVSAEDLLLGDKGFGAFRDLMLRQHARQLFGVSGTLGKSSTASIDAATAEADPTALVTAAKSLRVKVVSANAQLGANIDMMALWPQEKPTHIIACNEQDATKPGIQRISLADGSVETILTGTISCDPVEATAWGTIIVGEESGNTGSILELIDPLNTTGVTFDHATHALTGVDAGKVAVREAIGHTSFEGVVPYPNGVMYYGDENRPSVGTAGGAYFKFVPDVLWKGGKITSLEQSPLASGQVYGLRLGLRKGGTDYGQGTNIGLGAWVKIDNSNGADLRAAAADLKLTGYYRPEDADIDEAALAKGRVRFCANNTGNEEADHNWGETICITDGTVNQAAANTAIPEVQLFVTGTKQFAMMDNLAYQPGRGNWIIQEDGDAPGFETNPHNNDIWACLEDGKDVDTLSDGCVRILTVNDLNAETTGGFFDAAGKNYYFSVQHNVTGHGVILKLTNWK